MNKTEVLERIREIRLMPLFYHDDPAIAMNVMKAVMEGGMELLEFTNRGENAYKVFRELQKYESENHPDFLLGIGSIVDAKTAFRYIGAGADFVVSPLLSREVMEACSEKGVLCIPGCSTLTEIHQAENWGAELVKVFPAEQLGGPAYIKAIKGPCPWLSLIVTGGVKATTENIKSYHDAGAEGFGLGSDLISKAWIQASEYAAISEKVSELVRFVKGLER